MKTLITTIILMIITSWTINGEIELLKIDSLSYDTKKEYVKDSNSFLLSYLIVRKVVKNTLEHTGITKPKEYTMSKEDQSLIDEWEKENGLSKDNK